MKLIGVQAAYDRGYTGKDVIVGVVDSGAQMDHPDLAPNVIASLDSFTGSPVPIDEHGHGTHVAGTIAAAKNGSGVQGVAYDAKLSILRLLDADNASNSDVSVRTTLTEFGLAHGVTIFNNSWGCCEATPLASPQEVRAYVVPELAVYRKAVRADAILVWATGNEFQQQPGIQAALPIYFPDLQPNWLAVTAVGSDGVLASYANKCGVAANWCLAAPGGDEALPGQSELDAFIISDAPGSGLTGKGGTSMAAPHVSGALAIARQMFPDASGADLTYLTLATSIDKGAPGIDTDYGWGLLSVANLAVTRDPQAASVFANAQWASHNDQEAMLDAVQTRFGTAADSGPAAWGAALGRRAKHDLSASSFEAQADTAGLVMGLDVLRDADNRVGFAAGYTQTNLTESDSGNEADLQTFYGMAYAQLQRGRAFGEAVMGIQHQQQTFSRRTIPGSTGTVLAGAGLRGKSETEGVGLSGAVRGGWRFDTGLGAITPYIGGHVTSQDTEATEETGADVFSLSLPHQSLTQFSAGPGVEWTVKPIATQAVTFAPSLSVSYDRLWGDDDYGFEAQLLGSPVPGAAGDLGDSALSIAAELQVSPKASSFQGFIRGQYTALDKAEAFDLRLGFHGAF